MGVRLIDSQSFFLPVLFRSLHSGPLAFFGSPDGGASLVSTRRPYQWTRSPGPSMFISIPVSSGVEVSPLEREEVWDCYTTGIEGYNLNP